MMTIDGIEVPKYDCFVKLMMVGDSGVGKTSLLHRFVDEKFDPQFIATIGIDFKRKLVDAEGKKVMLQLWDTAGQERFRSITSSFYRGAQGVALVYDVADEDSFTNLGQWIRNIQALATEGTPWMILANKADMVKERVVSAASGEALARKYGVPFFETSARTGQNVSEAFFQLATTMTKKVLAQEQAESMGTPISPEDRRITIDVQKKERGCC